MRRSGQGLPSAALKPCGTAPLRCRHRSAGGAGGTGKHKEAAMSDFMRTLCKIAIPVTLQGMLQTSFSIVDQIMIGQLGEAGIAAVGLPHRGVLLSAHGGQHRPVRMAALQGTRRCPLLGKFWRGSGEHRTELSAHLRKAGCPRYGRYRCCHRHAGFPAFEPAFDLDRLCGLPSKGSGTPAHRGDLDTVGGRFMFIFRVRRKA